MSKKNGYLINKVSQLKRNIKNNEYLVEEYVNNGQFKNVFKIVPTIENICEFFNISIARFEESKKENLINEIGKSIFIKSYQVELFFTNQKDKLKAYLNIGNINEFCFYLFKDASKLEKMIIKEFEKERKKQENKIQKENSIRDKFVLSLKDEKDINTIVDTFYSYYFKKNFSDVSFESYIKMLGKKTVSDKNKIKKRNEYLTIKKRYTNNQGLVHGSMVSSLINISEKEYIKWRDQDLIKIHSYISFKKWGKNLKAPCFDYEYLLTITPKIIDKWRAESVGLFSSSQLAKWDLLKENLKENHKISTINNKFYYHPKLFDKQNFTLNIQIKTKVNTKTFLNINNCEQIVNNDLLKTMKSVEEIRIFNNFCQVNEISENELEIINKYFKGAEIFQKDLKKHLEYIFNKIISSRSEEYITNILDVKNYHNSFLNARSINREVSFIVGETNSGKTYEALESLIKAESGIYLAPLRLLAFEVYEKLNNTGVPCNLITGEEEIIIANAKHTASTIECVDLEKFVEVAIIDEFQMVNDYQRGWAWTQAILGTPASKLFIIGNSSALEKSITLLSNTNDSCKVIKKERISKLVVQEQSVSLKELKKGDALIAFSRQEVLEYAHDLKKLGKSVAIIYGNLSPEVRRYQAGKFNSGEADVLVTTDAIGMGLNLPIDRVIFSTLQKYDGICTRRLLDSEIKQISGRAGRFQNIGYVTVLDKSGNMKINKDYDNIKNILESELNEDNSLFDVCPNNWHLTKLSEILNTNNIKSILQYFGKLNNTSLYRNLLLDNAIELYDVLSSNKKFTKLPLNLQLKILLSPVDIKKEILVEYYRYLIAQLVNNTQEPFSIYDIYYNGRIEDLFSAEMCVKGISIYNYLSKYAEGFDRESSEFDRLELESYILQELELKTFRKKEKFENY